MWVPHEDFLQSSWLHADRQKHAYGVLETTRIVPSLGSQRQREEVEHLPVSLLLRLPYRQRLVARGEALGPRGRVQLFLRLPYRQRGVVRGEALGPRGRGDAPHQPELQS